MTTVRYVARRVLESAFVVWVAFTASFVLLYLLPSDPVTMMLDRGGGGANLDEAVVAEVRAEYGFDRAVPLQYLDRLGRALRLDFGSSMQNGRPVAESIAEALPETAKLTMAALGLAVLVSLVVASVATVTRIGWLRRLLLTLPPLGKAVPAFWIGLVLLQFVSFRLGLLPATGNSGIETLILPAVTLAIPSAAVITQVLAKGLEDTWRQPYVEVARAQGVPRWRIHLRHVLRNGAMPALTMLAIVLGNLLAGSVVIETVFSRTGVGRLTQAAVSAQDIPVVQGVVVLSAVIFVSANLLVDLVHRLLDPRVVTASAVRKAGSADG